MARMLLLLLLLVPASQATASEKTADQLLPTSTVLYVEVADPPALLETILEHPLRAKIEELPPYKKAKASTEYRNFQFGRGMLETHFGMKWREALETWTQHGVYAGFDMKNEAFALLVHGRDAESMARFGDKLVALVESGPNRARLKKSEYNGTKTYQLDQGFYAVDDGWLLVSNKESFLHGLLDRLAGNHQDSLAENPRYAAARAAQNGSPTAWEFVDLEAVRPLFNEKWLAAQKGNVALELLAGGLINATLHAPYETLEVELTNDRLGVRFALPFEAESVSEDRQYFFGPQGEGQAPELPELPNTIFTASAHRDLSQMWLRAGDLFDEKVNDDFAKADATLTTLFSGRDFGEEILGAIGPQLGLVAVRRNFDDVLPRSAIKLPAFALVMQLREPETMTRELRRIFQSLVGFLNVVSAMEGKPQLELGSERLEGDAELVTSTYVPSDDDRTSERADIVYNFSPTIAFRGETFVLASTTDLARQLVTAEARADRSLAANTQAELQGPALRQALEDNRQQLIAQNMLEQGRSRDEAADAIELLLTVLGYFDKATLQATVADEQLVVEFSLGVAP